MGPWRASKWSSIRWTRQPWEGQLKISITRRFRYPMALECSLAILQNKIRVDRAWPSASVTVAIMGTHSSIQATRVNHTTQRNLKAMNKVAPTSKEVVIMNTSTRKMRFKLLKMRQSDCAYSLRLLIVCTIEALNGNRKRLTTLRKIPQWWGSETICSVALPLPTRSWTIRKSSFPPCICAWSRSCSKRGKS